ncbi:hypothetical protein [Bacillus smithii]|uniref:hypothetical protein n=1 Tax=Bacillus smithii TaxID=1479 RepID=UPI0030C99CF9
MLTTIICIILSILVLTGLVTVNTRAVTKEPSGRSEEERTQLQEEEESGTDRPPLSQSDDHIRQHDDEDLQSIMADDEYRQVLKNFWKQVSKDADHSDAESPSKEKDPIKDEQYREALRLMNKDQDDQ